MSTFVSTGLTTLVGRERELRGLESRLAKGVRLITLLGPGGSGKTRLAREVFERLQAQGSEAYFVDLVGVLDPDLIPAEIATELGVTETADLDAAGAVVASLRESSSALVLDNLEELTGARDFLGRLLQAAPGVQLIATSRIPLGIPGEMEYQVQPLELPQGDGPSEVEASPAGALFLERARAVGRLDEVDTPTAKAVAELCRRLDGLPLALELAAARTRIMPPAAILHRLDDHTSGVLAKVGETDIRHESLDAVLTWSLDLLETNEAEVLAAVAVCPGGFDLAMAEALAPDRNVLRAIDVLATHGLLTQRGDIEGEPWYRLLETIRTAAIDRAHGDATRAGWVRFAMHLSERVAGTLDAFYRFDESAFRRLDAMLDNIRAVLDWTEVNDPALSLSIAGRFHTYWRIRGRHREGIPRLRTAIAANPYPSSDLALACVGVAVLERNIGGLPEVRRAAAEGARIARVVGDGDIEALALEQLVLGASEPDPGVAQRLRELLATVRNPLSRFGCLNALAEIEGLDSGHGSDAQVQYYRDAEAVLAGTPYRRFQGVVAANLAQVYLYLDRPIDAYKHSTRALAAVEDAGPEILAWVHSIRATAGASGGHIDEATASLRAALKYGTSSMMGLPPETLVGAVAVLSQLSAPLLAAKVWGAAMSSVGASPASWDRSLGDRLLLAARRGTDPVAFALAFKAGQKAGVAHVLDEVLAHLDGIAAPASRAGPGRLQHGTLTQREIEILALVGAGRSDAEIAADLFISPKTASVHVSNAKAKLGLETRLEAALWARERGLVEGEPDGS